MTDRTVYGEHTWSTMQMSEIGHFKKQTLDKHEWGGFEHIVMWSRISCINIDLQLQYGHADRRWG
eukprot:5086147-Heterocapsa_arctica.AAC.1